MRVCRPLAFACFAYVGALSAQTTDAVLTGRVLDVRNDQPIVAKLQYSNLATGEKGTTDTDTKGFYTFRALSPGTYLLRAEYPAFQAQEIYGVTVYVAARLDITFRLRPVSDILDAGAENVVLPETLLVLPVVGPDLEHGRTVAIRPVPIEHGILFATQSYVVDRSQIEGLPLTGRDVYAMLAMLPGVTTENATGRGLGFSVNGQRPSASNYLLDGVENNDYVATGPLSVAPPEAIEEYRVSTGNFSAEYGRTSGFVTNAVTRSGTDEWHGLAYFYLMNEALNANSFGRNAGFREDSGLFGPSLPPAPFKQQEAGAQLGGPLRRGVLFHSTSIDYTRNRTVAPRWSIPLPTTTFLDRTLAMLPATANARGLFEQFPPPPVASAADVQQVELDPPISINRTLLSERVDFTPRNSSHRLMLRGMITRRSQPDFVWTPYRDFVSGLRANTTAIAFGWTSAPRARITNDLRASWSLTHLRWGRAHPEIPTLQSPAVFLPGSPASYSYRNDNRSWELLDNVVVPWRAHIFKVGSGVLLRSISGYLTFGQSGLFQFDSLTDVVQDEPIYYAVAVDRQFRRRQPEYGRSYRYTQYFAFAEDSYRASERLTLNYGARYEDFGSPVNNGAVKDYTIKLDTPGGMIAAIRGASIEYPGPGPETLYTADHNDWSARLGFAYRADRDGRLTLRGGYGIFYDRPFDNLWSNLRNNNVVWQGVNIGVKINYLAPAADLINSLSFTSEANYLLAYQPGMRDGYAQHYFAGAQYRVSDFLFELSGSGSAGRKLITTDIVNRDYSEPTGPYNPRLSDFAYRGSQGSSSYSALIAVARYRARLAQFQAAYTWGHSIDNQSEPLAGEFFNLSFTRAGAASTNNALAAFSRQFDSRGDRGNSDFDQRHNVVFYSIQELPLSHRRTRAARIWRGWQVAELAAIRSGFPYTVFATVGEPPASGGQIKPNPRADLVSPKAAKVDVPVTGGRLLLNAQAFQAPEPGVQGNTGRNAFAGPGLFSVDLSLSRSFSLPWLGEGGRLVFRADAYNVLNHANLNNPALTTLGGPEFGIARFGRTGRSVGFPAIAPLNETARQIQLMLRIQF